MARSLVFGASAAVCIGCLVGYQPASAQESVREVRATGTGVASARPDYALITGRLEARAETAAAAAQKHRKMKAGLFKTLESPPGFRLALKFAGKSLARYDNESKYGPFGDISDDPFGEIERSDDPFGDVQADDDDPFADKSKDAEANPDDSEPKKGFSVNETVLIRLNVSEDDDLERVFDGVTSVIDVAVQAGVTFSFSDKDPFRSGDELVHVVEFGVEDPSVLDQKAREDAFADARAQAESLAKLAGAKVGKVLDVSMGQAFYREDEPNGKSLSIGPIEYAREVEVSFELVD